MDNAGTTRRAAARAIGKSATPDLFTPIASDCAALPFIDADAAMGRMTRAEAAVLREASEILERRIRKSADVMGRPAMVRDFLSARIGGLDREAFVVLFLNSQNGLIAAEELFIGTLNQTAVYPREIARRALQLNAAGCVLAHNHPSGTAEPSAADKHLTRTVATALRILDVIVLDHVVVAGRASYSFAEHGLI